MTNNPVYHFFHTPGNPGPLILRMSIAGLFFFHAAQKTVGWFGGPGWSATLVLWAETLGFPAVLAGTLIVAEVLICLALFFGFFTRLAGLAVAAIMAGSIVLLARGATDVAQYELPMLVCASGLTLFFIGAGSLSLDRALSRNLLPVIG